MIEVDAEGDAGLRGTTKIAYGEFIPGQWTRLATSESTAVVEIARNVAVREHNCCPSVIVVWDPTFEIPETFQGDDPPRTAPRDPEGRLLPTVLGPPPETGLNLGPWPVAQRPTDRPHSPGQARPGQDLA
jgi:hypothetical protein